MNINALKIRSLKIECLRIYWFGDYPDSSKNKILRQKRNILKNLHIYNKGFVRLGGNYNNPFIKIFCFLNYLHEK